MIPNVFYTTFNILYIFTYTVQTLGNIVFLKEVSYAHQAWL